MNRRHALGTIAAAALLPRMALAQDDSEIAVAQTAAAPQLLAAAWDLWKSAYLAEDGRVVDELQEGSSHSESQGYGLFLAATMQDRDAFDLIDRWTMANLALREDSLLAWRWLPNVDDHVPDLNNASDGDLFYAWGLVRAASSFDRPQFRERAGSIARDLAAKCMVTRADTGGILFVPAAQGFTRDTGVVLNPSYYMPLAMQEIARATGISAFASAAREGARLMDELADQGLMPDWITLGPDGFYPDPTLASRNGYEAMRVPLFLTWSGLGGHAAVVLQAQALQRAQAATLPTPTVMDRTTYNVLETSPDAGYAALSGLVSCAATNTRGAAIPRFTIEQPYYPATLHLFALLAQIEATPSCVPI